MKKQSLVSFVVCLAAARAAAQGLPRFVPGAARPGSKLVGAHLRGARLSGADLAGADLTNADLDGADLRDADLRGARLGGVTLRRTRLDGARLDGATLESSALDGASLTRASLVGADLGGLDLRSVELSGAVYDQTTILPLSADEASRRGLVRADADRRAASPLFGVQPLVAGPVAVSPWTRPSEELRRAIALVKAGSCALASSTVEPRIASDPADEYPPYLIGTTPFAERWSCAGKPYLFKGHRRSVYEGADITRAPLADLTFAYLTLEEAR